MTPPTPPLPPEPPPPVVRIAIIGAESSGKTTLARDLATALAAAHPAARGATPRVALVPEVLREWCDLRGRTPRRDEQHGILVEQHRRIEAATAAHDIVVCDTTALMTHVYSELVFGDASLREAALERHRTMAATLLMSLDLPWVADGLQRDGEHVRQPVDDRLRDLLRRHALPFSVVAGHGPARLARAMAALRPLLARLAPGSASSARSETAASDEAAKALKGPGLFTRLPPGTSDAPAGGEPLRRRHGDWVCDCCVPDAERALLRARTEGGASATAGGLSNEHPNEHSDELSNEHLNERAGAR